MARSTSPWGQPEDPGDHTVDLPRMDVGELTDYLRRNAPLVEQEPAGLLEPLPEESAGLHEPLPKQQQGPGPGSPYAGGARGGRSLPPVSSRPGGLLHPYPGPLGPDSLLPAAPASEFATPSITAPEPASPEPAPSEPAAPAPTAPEPSATMIAAAADQTEAAKSSAPSGGAQMTPVPPKAGAPAAQPLAGPPSASLRGPATHGREPAGSLADLKSRLARLPEGHPSSPYDDAGRARPLPIRLRQLELGLPAPNREFAGGTAQEIDDPDIERDPEQHPAEPELARNEPTRALPESGSAEPGEPSLGSDVGAQEAPELDPAAADEPATEVDDANHRTPREWGDPYAGADNGRAAPARADLSLRPWQPSPSPHASDMEGRRAGGGNDSGLRNGHGTGSGPQPGHVESDRPDQALGEAARRDTAQLRVAEPQHADLREVVERTLATCRAAEGRNALGSYGASGLTPAIQRLAAQLPFGGLAADSEAGRLKSSERLSAKLARLVARSPGRTPEELAAEIGDVVGYAFTFEAADYVEGTWLVHRRLKSHGFELEIRRNRWESPEHKGIFTQWRDPAHHLSFEVQFHTTASWAVLQRTHPEYVQIIDPGTAAAERATLRARQVAAAATAKPPANWAEIGDFRLEAR